MIIQIAVKILSKSIGKYRKRIEHQDRTLDYFNHQPSS